MISLASVSVDPLIFLQDLDHSNWLTPAARETILLREIQIAQAAIPANAPADDYSRTRVFQAQNSLIELYAAQHEDARALAVLRSLDASQRNSAAMQQTEIVLTARTGQLDALLANYRSQPDTAPGASVLQAAAAELSRDNRPQTARALLEFAFDRSLSSHTLASTDYLALADARLHTNDLAGALSLLHSLVQTSGDTYANLDSAAALLEKNSHAAEAVPFLTTLARSVPWDLSYSARLAEAQQSVKDPTANSTLAVVARNPLAPYALRTQTARDLAGTGAPPDLGSSELKLLASVTIAPAASQQPYFVAARTAAAAQSHDAKQQASLLREAIAIAPDSPRILLDLFHAELRLGDAPATRAALDALLQTPSSAEADFTAPSRNDVSANYEADDEPTVGGSNYAPQPALAASMSVADRAKLATDFGEVYLRDDDAGQAISYFKLALHFASTDPHAADIRAKIASIEDAQRLEAANDARRPVIHKTLDQAITVRQRLTVAPDEAPPAPKKEEE